MFGHTKFRISQASVSLVVHVLVLSNVIPSEASVLIQPEELFNDLHLGSNVSATSSCRGDNSCKESFNVSDCVILGICQIWCPNGSRTALPEVVFITHSSTCPLDSTSGLLSHVNQSNGNLFVNSSTNKPCQTTRNVSAHPLTGHFAISLWLKGVCNNCSVFQVGSEIEVRIQGEDINIGDSLLPLSNTAWTHLLLNQRLRTNSAEVFLNGKQVTLNQSIHVSEILQNETFLLGPSGPLVGDDFISISDARFYEDGLSTSEITYLLNGTAPPAGMCRCPDVHPDVLPCGTSSDRTVKKEFYGPVVILDNDTSTAWASASTLNVTVSVSLGNAFQINNVTVVFKPNGSIPTATLWQFEIFGQIEEIDGTVYTCDPDSCSLKSYNESTYAKTIAEAIHVTFLNGTSGLWDRYIIEDIYITGWCDCNGVATNCTRSEGSRDYTCMCQADLVSSHCRNSTPETPTLTLYPGYGPVSGGTEVNVTGYPFDSNVTVTIGGIIQDMKERADTYVIFTTKNASKEGVVDVTVVSDVTIEGSGMFTYLPDPNVLMDSVNYTLTTSATGGCTVIVRGGNLNSTAFPKLQLSDPLGMSNTTVCEVDEMGDNMTCPTPSLTSDPGSWGDAHLLFDGVHFYNVTRFRVTKSADFDEKEIEFSPPFKTTISITGSNFGVDCPDTQYKVFIGSEDVLCDRISVTETEIMCDPPQQPPEGAPSISSRHYQILVKIGSRESEEAGTLYYKPFWLTSYFVYAIAGGTLGVVVLIIICYCLVSGCRRRNRPDETSMCDDSKKTFVTNTFVNVKENSKAIPMVEMSVSKDCQPLDNQYCLFDETNDLDSFNEHRSASQTATSSGVVDKVQEVFLESVEESLRADVGSSLIAEQDFTLGNICVLKGQHVRLIDGSFTSASCYGEKKITIKMLKEPLPDAEIPSQYMTALKECLRLKAHRDQFILTIHGIGLDSKRFYIIYPYMGRTLKEHIVNVNQEFKFRQLLEFALQVCEGMEYLSSRDVVHKDIAARNCMVDVKDNVKLSDSAFSWDFYPDEYMYDSLMDRYLPVRWMAPESLTAGFYHTKSDVWSFGVLMWELLTRGVLPYHEVKKDEELRDFINDGYRLGQPHMVDNDTYVLMKSCWMNEGDARPSFSSLRVKVATILTGSQSTDGLYLNVAAVQGVYTYIEN